MPSADTIALLAALLRTREQEPRDVIDDAISLHLLVQQRCASLEGLTLADVIAELRDPDLDGWLFQQRKVQPKLLRLYPDKPKPDEETRARFFNGDLDPARQYLNSKASYLCYGTTEKVWHAIRMMLLDEARAHNEKYKDRIEAEEKVRRTTRWKRPSLHSWGYDHSRKHRRDGHREFEWFRNRWAVRERVTADEVLQEMEQQDHVETRVLYWELPPEFLKGLITWRIDVRNNRGEIKKLERELRRLE